MSPASVHRIVRRELEDDGGRRGLLADQAQAVLTERTEALWRAHYPAAMRGDYKSSVICTRILDQQTRALARRQRLEDANTGDGDEVEDDELTAWRKRRLG